MEKTVREQLLESATKLFAEKGFAEVSLESAAKTAGVDNAEAVKLFTNKAKLYEAVLEAQFSHYAARLGAPFGGDDEPELKIESFANAMCGFHKEAPYFFPLFYRELLTPSSYFESIVIEKIRHVAYLSDNNIARGIQKGKFMHGVNPANATMFLVGIFHYYFLANRLVGSLLPETTNDEEYFSQALKVYLSGLKEEEL